MVNIRSMSVIFETHSCDKAARLISSRLRPNLLNEQFAQSHVERSVVKEIR